MAVSSGSAGSARSLIPRLVSVASVAVLAAVGLAACANDEKQDDDGEITVYSGRAEELVGPLIKEFEKKHDIKVTVRYGETAAMASQILEEGSKTKADVFLAQDAGALGAVSKDNLFVELPTSITEQVPADYRGKDNKWVGVTGRARVIVYNPNMITEAELPTSALDLTDPKWSGKVGIAPTNASFQAFVTAIRVEKGDAAAERFLSGLKNNNPQLREKNGLILDDVDSGQFPIGLINHYYWYEKQAEVGEGKVTAKLHFLRNGDPGALVNVSGAGILKQSKSDKDARTFVEYLLSKQGQQYFAEETFEYPLAAGVQAAPGLPSLSELNPPKVDLDDLDSLETTVRMIKDSGLTS